ncbi:hypothetical protein [Allorhodopirellula solitaria]|uniref:Uncharacterized protein n=1 Tax=Allorhodopirellula solitaria TaxID=2527987 RepID=A0A5C5XR27_9BACT|nr:hypothetical protein [Allorhodopirellula solitaria]TWT64961.1 hypothetical protein CA85_33060 [Allorhodopirellula solitaria]
MRPSDPLRLYLGNSLFEGDIMAYGPLRDILRWARLCAVFALAVFGCVLACSTVDATDFENGRPLTTEEKAARFDAMTHQDWFAGKRYRYRVRCIIQSDESPPIQLQGSRVDLLADTERELIIGEPYRGSNIFPLYIAYKIENPGIPIYEDDQVIWKWYAFNGRESRSWENNLFDERSQGLHHDGVVSAQNSARLLTSDPFFGFLTGLSRYRCSGGSVPKLPYSFNEIDSREIDYPPFGACVESRAKALDESGETLTNITLDAPEYLTLFASSESHVYRPITEIATFNQQRFPGKGSRQDTGCTWEYELISVEDFETPARAADWFPDWPRGTSVTDRTRDKILRIPFSPGETKAIQDYILTTQKLGLPAIGWSIWTWVSAVMLMILVSLIGFKVYKSIRA